MARLDKETYDKVIEALEAADGEPRSYSGRSMHGKDCVGVTCGDPLDFLVSLSVAVCENAEDLDEARELIEAFANPRNDSMGRGSAILYWPGLDWQGDDEGSDEDGEGDVEVDTSDYEGSHGHGPGGTGEWMFAFGAEGEASPDSLQGRKIFSHNGSYAQAKKAAVAKAKADGHGTVYVLS